MMTRAVKRLAILATALMLWPSIAGSRPLPKAVSLNVCTDQLAILVAAPGQLLSVSHLSHDPEMSSLYREARAYPVNHGLAEEVFALKPDVVLTGTFSLHSTAGLLDRLGYPVERFDYTQSLDTIPADIRRVGTLLARERQAEQLAADFERRRAGLSSLTCSRKPTVLYYGARGIVLGEGTLADSIMRAAGLDNLAGRLGYRGLAPFPLELLVLDPPDLLLIPPSADGAPSLANRSSVHPVLARMPRVVRVSREDSAKLSCGGPFTLQLVEKLQKLAGNLAICAGMAR